MSLDWCQGIREACTYWSEAKMFHQTFEALEQSLEQDNDACIDGAKAVVEELCRIIVECFHSAQNPILPAKDSPSLTDWMGAANRALKLGDVRDNQFRKLVISHNKMAEALNDMRNASGPVSHGKAPFLERLSIHHRRSVVLSADAIVSFLHKAYLDSQLNPASSKEPWERFAMENELIDKFVRLSIDDEDEPQTLKVLLPNGDEFPLEIPVSQLLYEMDRGVYIEALMAAQSAQISGAELESEV